MKLYISKKENNIILYDVASQKDHIYIPIEEIDKTIISKNKIHSYWIEKYYKNVFIETDSIYEFVIFINEISPNNNINWFSQIYEIEYYQKLLNNETLKNEINDFWSRYQFEKDKKYLESSMSNLNKYDIAEIKGNVLIQMIEYELV